ncbi:protein kinase domain-containing protein [Nocardioides sp.]|uniref:protein kinase domain-containing protein n=1 Tax=Nocardioides sp. TaxID=35761 RepID=UPI0039E7189B
MTRHRPGDMLAGRYRLDDLMSETGQGRFWRGYDTVLARPVAIHVLDSGDERAPLLLAAARAAAQIVETRLLKILDVANDPDITYVVNEWGQGTSLDHLVAAEGPLPPRRAAWIADEVAQALVVAHERGVCHGRLNPENVLIDTAGAVRIIGFAVEAALYGLGPDRIAVDVTDLVGILHFGLSGKWAGLSESATPPAPREHDRLLRPRQIRAGVPRVLDDLCDEVLNRPHGRHAGPNTAREIHDRLAGYVGDPSGLAGELASEKQATAAIGEVAQAKPQLADTQAGTPIFEDSGEVRWFSPRKTKPAPAPPPEPIPERPLFADAPRRARVPEVVSPFETPAGVEEDEAGHHWLRVAIVAATLVALVAIGLTVWQLLTDSDDTAGADSGGSTSATTSQTAEPTGIEGITGLDFDPDGDPPTESRDIAGDAVDGDVTTSWRTSSYNQQFGPPANYKAGVGYLVDLGASYAVDSVDLTFAKAGTTVQFYVLSDPPTEAPATAGLTPANEATVGTHDTVSVSGTGRYLLLWFTALPTTDDGRFRTQLAEVSVTGTPA